MPALVLGPLLRYVDATRLTTTKYTTPWKGYVTRSVWRNGTWVKVWTHRAKTVKYPNALGQVGVAGPKLLLGQVNVDVSGDGRIDLVGFYQDAFDHYLLIVEAGQDSASTWFTSYAEKPFIGAAAVDGVSSVTASGRWTASQARHWARPCGWLSQSS